MQAGQLKRKKIGRSRYPSEILDQLTIPVKGKLLNRKGGRPNFHI